MAELLLPKLNEIHRAVDTHTTNMQRKMDAMQRQIDSIELEGKQTHGGYSGKSLSDTLKENDGLQRLLSDRKGRAVLNFDSDAARQILQRKTTITSGIVGAGTSGVLPIGRLPDITREARQQLTVRDVLDAQPTTFQVIDFVRVLQPMSIASPVPEASLKPENQMTFTSHSERVKTIATWIPASRQILDDFEELRAFLESSLGYYVDLAEEQQILSGDGTGENLNGLIPQASMFNLSLMSSRAGWNKIDMIGRGIQQITAASEIPPSFVVLNPNDWWDVRLTKDGFGRYILGDPQSSLARLQFGSLVPIPALFDLQVVATNNMSRGTFLLGSGSPIASSIRDRMELVVEISTEHQDFFTKNLVALRAERRLALVTRRPGSYVCGVFSTSP